MAYYNRLVKNGVLATASTKYHECSIRQKTDVVQSLVKKRLYFSLHAALRSKKFETVKDPQQGMTLAAALDTTLPSKRAGIASVHRRPKPAITINTGMVSVGAKRPQPTPVFPPTFSWNDILCVQHLIERCLRQYLSKNDILIILKEQANVDPAFADVVWQKLEEQNTRFFRAYSLQLQLKEQILAFNYLVGQQKEMTANSRKRVLHNNLNRLSAN
ncbi:unnamed protein product [Peronospora belbahrii]|uniref:Uncharacterized protein n=1 Tax=Peronospora belbahrii TaxID=622444 RepID=A0AAU9KJC1_9STRA|nr:unnamed protein product [Peronospora belbahrii]